jgi:hypothetical protein
MVVTKSITEQLTEFNKIIDDLANVDVNLEDEDKALHLLCALPKSYESFKDTALWQGRHCHLGGSSSILEDQRTD